MMPHAVTATDASLFKAMVDQAAAVMVLADRDGRIVVWNRAAEKVFGYPAAEAIGRSLDLIVPERLRPAHWQGFRRAVESGHTKYADRVMTTRSVHKNGSKLYIDISFGLIHDETGTLAGVLAIGHDCTARQLAAREAAPVSPGQ
jgi:PAS domain S-box-containing protein